MGDEQADAHIRGAIITTIDMNRGNAVLILVALVGVVVVAGAAYYVGTQKAAGPEVDVNMPAQNGNALPNPGQATGATPSAAVNWQVLLPQIRPMLTNDETAYSPADPRAQAPVSVSTTTDITGDGISEAIINIPWGGGAASWYVAVMQIKNGKPVLATIKDEKGKIANAYLLEAGSAGYAMRVELDKENRAIAYTSYGQVADPNNRYWPYAGGYSTCGVAIYSWNPQTGIFEWNASLGNQLQTKYCIKASPSNTP